jgi:hypothetical protein
MVYYHVGQHECTTMDQAFVDRRANGGICGEDMLVDERSELFVDVSGLEGHRENNNSGGYQHTQRSSHCYLPSKGFIL